VQPTPIWKGQQTPTKKIHEKTAQSERFIEAARDLGCNEDEAACDEVIKKVAKVPSRNEAAESKSVENPAKKKFDPNGRSER